MYAYETPNTPSPPQQPAHAERRLKYGNLFIFSPFYACSDFEHPYPKPCYGKGSFNYIVEYAERRTKYGNLFIFSPVYACSDLEYVHVPVQYRVHHVEHVIRIRVAWASHDIAITIIVCWPLQDIVYFQSFVHESIVLSFVRPTCIAHTVAILLHGY